MSFVIRKYLSDIPLNEIGSNKFIETYKEFEIYSFWNPIGHELYERIYFYVSPINSYDKATTLKDIKEKIYNIYEKL